MIKSIKYAALTLGVMAMSACSDYLDQVPDDRIDITIKSEDDEQNVIMMLNTAYPTANYAWIAEISGDNMIDNMCPHLPSSPNEKQILSHYNYGSYAKYDDEMFRFEPANSATYSDWDSPGFVWEYYFSSIATCNYVINAIDEWTAKNNGQISTKLKAALAEAKILRAYDHFILANLFCQPYRDDSSNKAAIGLPYITQPEKNLIVKYDRGNVADLYKHIEEDLEAGLKDISNVHLGVAYKYHFNEEAAHAFAARYYLYTRQYEKVVEHANFVLTDTEAGAKKKLLDYSIFDGCASGNDYANKWQSPETTNNLMLNCTASIVSRKFFGYRYSYAGDKCQETLMIRTNSPLWSGYICPIQSVVSFNIASSSYSDYGFTTMKIQEQFEYTNKNAGIGIPHVVQRTFTGNELILNRAEAKVMLGQYDEAVKDLMTYWNYSYESMTQEAKDNNKKYWNDLTPENLVEMYSVRNEIMKKKDPLTGNVTEKDTTYILMPNSFFPEMWNENLQSVSSDFRLKDDKAYIYMNCINDFRRWETAYEGLRFFDLKRWGIPYEHKVDLESMVHDMLRNDAKRALEAPWETLASGLQSSRDLKTTPDTRSIVKFRRDDAKLMVKSPAKQ